MQVTLFTRPGCHLCDEARAVVLEERERSAFELVEIDIESSDALFEEYGLRIPVVAIDGVEAFEFTVVATAFADLVRSGRTGL
jgi:glutaredoxin